MALTDTALRAAKPSDKPYKLSDGGGLFLLVNPTGSRLWRLKYRIDGLEKQLAIGAYPDVTLAKAREKRDEARRKIADGIDPSAERKQAKLEAIAAIQNTFHNIASEYQAKLAREGLSPITLGKRKWLLDFALPALGDRDIATITPRDVLDVLRTIEAAALALSAL